MDDPAVRAVFALQGIIKADPLTRAKQALERVRPSLQSHGGDVELERVEGDTAFVRLHGACSGCSMSAVTLRDGVEEALVRDVDEIERVEVLEDRPTANLIPLESIGADDSKTSSSPLEPVGVGPRTGGLRGGERRDAAHSMSRPAANG